MPGPASSVVERSLRKIPSEGTAVRSPPQDDFSIAINSQEGLTEIQYVDGFFQSRNLDRKAVATSLLSEEERNLEKWPMTLSDCSKMTSSTLISQH